MATFKHILYEGALNDDFITVCSDNSVLLTYYTYATDRFNNITEKSFGDIDKAIRWYRRKFGDRVFSQGKEWIKRDNAYGFDYSGTPEEYWTEVVYEQGIEI